MIKNLRILTLLCILLVVAVGVYRDGNQDWRRAVVIGLYPINADGSAATDAYINQLSPADFREIDRYITEQMKPYQAQGGQNVQMYYRLGDRVHALPPAVPRAASIPEAMLWSLRFRYYAARHRPKTQGKPNLSLFLLYFDPKTHKTLAHTSTALENGRIGVVHLFAGKKHTQTNNVIIAHESLHGFGATDHYDLATGQPIYPIGYAHPNQNPLYPQTHAELMAMHIAKTPTTFEMARTLDKTLIGETTAKEIGWIK